MSTIIPYLYLGIGGLFLLYFIILWIHCGRIPAFGWFWPMLGSVALSIGLFTMEYHIEGPDGITTVFFDENIMSLRTFAVETLPIVLLVLTVIICITIYFIASYGKKHPSGNADYLIILGAHVNGTKPSKALMSRIMAAFHYLKSNPHTKAILTGGQGRGEKMTEALCMKQELLKLGIEESRLLIEDKSTTTEENIVFAKKIILQNTSLLHSEKTGVHHTKQIPDKKLMEDIHIIVVTNDFHTLRGRWLAKKAGFSQVETLGSASSFIMKPHYYTREILSWIKLAINRSFYES